jgi:hypothetical protein
LRNSGLRFANSGLRLCQSFQLSGSKRTDSSSSILAPPSRHSLHTHSRAQDIQLLAVESPSPQRGARWYLGPPHLPCPCRREILGSDAFRLIFPEISTSPGPRTLHSPVYPAILPSIAGNSAAARDPTPARPSPDQTTAPLAIVGSAHSSRLSICPSVTTPTRFPSKTPGVDRQETVSKNTRDYFDHVLRPCAFATSRNVIAFYFLTKQLRPPQQAYQQQQQQQQQPCLHLRRS